jgi:hypothetical protein
MSMLSSRSPLLVRNAPSLSGNTAPWFRVRLFSELSKLADAWIFES